MPSGYQAKSARAMGTAPTRIKNSPPPLIELNQETGLPEVKAALMVAPDGEYPPPRKLDDIGMAAWNSVIEILRFRHIMSKDWLEPLHTMCFMISTCERLKLAFEQYVLEENDKNGNVKISPALAEWSRLVALLRGYYQDFGLTPSSIRAANGPSTPGPTATSTATKSKEDDDLFKE